MKEVDTETQRHRDRYHLVNLTHSMGRAYYDRKNPHIRYTLKPMERHPHMLSM
jgi:hypothetical protein